MLQGGAERGVDLGAGHRRDVAELRAQLADEGIVHDEEAARR